ALDHRHRVDLFGNLKYWAHRWGNRVVDTLVSRHGPDGEHAVGAKVGVASALTHQKQRRWAFKAAHAHWPNSTRLVRPAAGFAARFALGRGVRASHQPQRGNGHLAAQRPLHPLIDDPLQLDGAQWLAAVEGDLAHRVLCRTEGRERRAQIGVIGQEDGNGALYLHTL